MPSLEFKGKQFVYTHHLSVPFRELVIDAKKSLPAGKPSLDDNLIIHGDNLHALKALLPQYAGKVKCIYIDPPYNTGNEGWCYNDNVRSPLMQEWVERGNPVDGEDMERHDKWLSMMYPRLRLLRDLLADDGAIFVSIDDNEHCNLRGAMDEIFGESNFMANIIWQKKYSVSNDDKGIGVMHDYIVLYSKTNQFKRNLLPRTEKAAARYTNLDNDKRGPWTFGEYVSNKSKTERPTLWYSIKHPLTGDDIWPDVNAVWRYTRERHSELEAEGRLYWGPNQNYKRPRLKRIFQKYRKAWFRRRGGAMNW